MTLATAMGGAILKNLKSETVAKRVSICSASELDYAQSGLLLRVIRAVLIADVDFV